MKFITILVLCLVVFLSSCARHEFVSDDAIFEVRPSEVESLEETTLRAFRNYARLNSKTLGFKGGTETALEQLEIGSQSFHNDKISIVRLIQNYRGLPIHKDRGQIALVIRDDSKVVNITGKLINPSIEYSGFSNPMPVTQARDAIAGHWTNEIGGSNFDVGILRLVALPELEQVAYAGEITTPFLTSSQTIEGSVLVNAATGDLIAIEDRPAEARALVTEIDDNPRNLTLVLRDDLPTDVLGNAIDFSDRPDIDCNPIGWRPIRLGDATRHTVVSLDGSGGSSISHFEGAQCASDTPVTDFLGGTPGPVESLNDQLLAQDEFVKTQLALAIIDPLMGELITHGSEHPYSWTHHPSTPDMIHRSPLINVVNANNDWFNQQPGIYKLIRLSEADTNTLDFPVPHPLVFHCRDSQGDRVDCDDPQAGEPFQYISFLGARAIPPFHTRTLLHEVGHYYDNFNSYGISGDNGEIVAQLFSLYLHRRIYDLDYRLTGNNEVECDLGALVGHSAGLVVHPECISDLDQISTQIDFEGPYTVKSFTQAYWSLLYGVSCTTSSGGLNCNVPSGLSADYPDRWMEALLFALQLGNNLEPVEIWNNIAVFIDANYPEDSARLQTVRTLHGLL